jgi:hypothetical protein
VPLTDSFSDRILTRVWMISAVLSLLAAIALWIRFNAAFALSFLLGAIVAIVNLRWLEGSVRRMLDADLSSGKRLRIWPKMLLRYLFLAAIAYVIFKGYFVSVSALLAGLFVPIIALMLEAAYEAYVAFKS